MGLFNAVMALSGMIDTDIIEDERLARHTSYRIGGKADLFVTCHSYHALRRAVAVLDREQVRGSLSARDLICLLPMQAIAAPSFRWGVSSSVRLSPKTVVR